MNVLVKTISLLIFIDNIIELILVSKKIASELGKNFYTEN